MDENMTRSALIKVLIVDDHQVVRDGLNLMLMVNPGFLCVGQAENGQEAIQLCAELKPDVILMDLRMPEMDGIEATRLIHKDNPQVQVVALTSFEDKELVKKALRAGAISYILKNAAMEIIIRSVREAYEGRPTLSPAVIDALIENQEDQIPPEELTARELEILKLMAEGLTNRSIAERLFISEATARFHVSNILAKLGAANRTEAVRQANKRHLID
jgi:two-component system, NarL family, response regulator LiaR